MKKIAVLFLLIGCTHCIAVNERIITLEVEKDLIPEGIAIDAETKSIYLNSLMHSKILKCSIEGDNTTQVIAKNEYGYLPGFGMTIKGDTLFALGNGLESKTNRSILLLLNIRTGGLIDSYMIHDSTQTYLNDIAVSAKNDIYITDSESNRIYTIQHSRNQLELFLESNEIAHSNGIAISDDSNYLYLASYRNGIRVVDIKTREIINTPNKAYAGIDGMKYYRNSLLGIVNARRDPDKNGLYRYYLNKENTAVVRMEKMVPIGATFKIPTTFDIYNGHVYYIINSQLDNFNQKTNQIIDHSILEPYKILKKKID